MKHISILVPDGPCNFSSIAGTYKVFKRTNQLLESFGREAAFSIEVVGHSEKNTAHDGLFTIQPHANFSNACKPDIIIIPAISGNFAASVENNKILVDWVSHHYRLGAEVASICTGAFLLASSGLLKNRQCSTHWMAEETFGKMFPDVQLVTHKLITDEKGIYTNGGAFSFLNLLLYLVEKYCGRDISIHCAKIFEIDINRNCQSPFTIFLGQKEHADEVIKKAQEFIENNADQKISIEALADKMAISKRSFERRFKKATNNTPVEYLQRVKMERAKKSLETTRKNIHEVMYDTGYSDMKAFRTIFKKVTGLSPLEYRNRYNKEAADSDVLI